jgi:hypothetical protein
VCTNLQKVIVQSHQTIFIAVKAARALTQALSNIVTSNDALVDMVWESYMNLPEDEVVLVYVSLNLIHDW